jgi:plasmid stability protein
MGQILIRGLNDEAIASHRRRAKMHGRSLEHELRMLIEASADYSGEEKLAIAEYAQSLTPANASATAVELIREDRER